MELVEIKINGKKIKAFKTIHHILSCDYPRKVLSQKIKYQINFNADLYNSIPTIVEIDNKKFYKSDINDINQKYFNLIEY